VFDSGFVVPVDSVSSIESLDRENITTVFRKIVRILGNASHMKLTASSPVSPVDMATFADPSSIPRGDRTHIVENVPVFRAFINFAFCFGSLDPVQLAKTFTFRSFLTSAKFFDKTDIHDALFRFGRYYDHLFGTDKLFHNLIMIPYGQVRDVDFGLGTFSVSELFEVLEELMVRFGTWIRGVPETLSITDFILQGGKALRLDVEKTILLNLAKKHNKFTAAKPRSVSVSSSFVPKRSFDQHVVPVNSVPNARFCINEILYFYKKKDKRCMNKSCSFSHDVRLATKAQLEFTLNKLNNLNLRAEILEMVKGRN
jgi:hypothetical protein